LILEIISTAALPPSDFSTFKKFCTNTRARKPFLSFRMTTITQFTFNDLNSDIHFVNYDMLHSSELKSDNFCKNTFKI